MLKEIIKQSPNWIQKPIKNIYYSIPYEKKLGKEFINTYDFLQKSQWWTKKQQEEYQMMQVEKLLEHAYKNVPYYTKIFNERGLRPKDIQNFHDLKQLPYLTKEIIRKNLDELVAKNYDKEKLRYVTTGGSTGIPMGFYVDRNISQDREWAFMSTQWTRVGYNINKKNRCVILRGDIPEKGIFEYRGYNLILSSFQLTKENMMEYIKLIKNFNPDFIQAYPSSINILSDYILENNIKIGLANLKAILCGSENLYDFQRNKINEAFGVNVYSWYGHTEQCCLAGECEKNNYYHIFSEYGYAELINEKGQDITKEDEIGEIVATGFNNYVVPFIRYKTCDMAVNTNEICECGREYKLIKRIEGRKQEYFVDKNGEKITLTGSYKILDGIKQYIECGQFFQDTKGIVELNLIRKKKYCEDETVYIINKLDEKFKNKIYFKVNFVDHIERTNRGKFKFLIQKLNMHN